jgi:WD40 repeat protein
LAGLNRNQVWIWNVESNEFNHVPIEPKIEGEYQLRCLSWSPDGRRIAIGDRKGTIYWFDVESRRIVDQFQLSKANINYLAWSPDGKSIAVASSSPTIQIVSVEEMKVTQELDGHSFENWSVDWSPDGHRIASAGGDKQVIVWDPSITTPLISFSMSAEARSVAWSHNGHNLAAISQDGQVKVWSADFGYQAR